MRRIVIKLLLTFVLVLVVIGITGCQSQVIPDPDVPCSIEITSPESMEQLDGNGTYAVKWDWIGSDKEINLMLVGYNKDEEEIGIMPIDFVIPASAESYTWGPNFGAEIFTSFPEDWPWWFKIEADVPDTDIWDASGFFSVQWDYNL